MRRMSFTRAPTASPSSFRSSSAKEQSVSRSQISSFLRSGRMRAKPADTTRASNSDADDPPLCTGGAGGGGGGSGGGAEKKDEEYVGGTLSALGGGA